MCGILFLNTQISVEKVRDYFNQIAYRGPDNTNILVENGMYFCHHRLSIINPENENGNQPICKDDCILICNGEIYNYMDLLATKLDNMMVEIDCEVIIHLYKRYGIKKTLDLIDGDFAFVLYDKKRETIITGRDPVGLKPLYIGYKNNEIVGYSSEIKSLNEIADHIVQHPIGTYTVNGHLYKYFDYHGEITYFDIEKNINYLLTESINKRITHTDRPYAFLCSGGIDSSLVLAIASEILNKKDIHVFSIEYDDGSVSYDSFYAKMLTDIYQVKHTIVKFKKEDALKRIDEIINKIETYDINTVRASIPMYLLAEYISQNTDYKVILSGEGADELFMGYSYFNYCTSGDMTVNEQKAREESLRLTTNLHSFDVLRAERCFSSHGLELRVPFLDRNFISYVLNINGISRLPQDGLEKYILRKSFEDLKEMPKQILYRQKERFSDGIGFMWVPTLMKHADEVVKEIDDRYNYYNGPKNKEEYYYRNIFEKYYPNRGNIIIERSMPQWLDATLNVIKSTKLID